VSPNDECVETGLDPHAHYVPKRALRRMLVVADDVNKCDAWAAAAAATAAAATAAIAATADDDAVEKAAAIAVVAAVVDDAADTADAVEKARAVAAVLLPLLPLLPLRNMPLRNGVAIASLKKASDARQNARKSAYPSGVVILHIELPGS
jgi:hypothetical protein